MKIGNVSNIHHFMDAVKRCSGDVYLNSKYGDVYNLKSQLSQYVAMPALLGYHGNELDLMCNSEDECNFAEWSPET